MNAWQLVGPFVVAALAGAALAFFELLRTFQRHIGSAVRNKWGLVLLGINAASAIGVYAIVRYVIGFDQGIWTALVVGATFPVLIRSRFTFYRQLAGRKDDLAPAEFSLKLDEFYQSLQDLCYSEVNLFLAEKRRALAEALKVKHTPKQLEQELRDLIAAEPIQAEQEKHEKALSDILKVSNTARREQLLALLLVDISTAQRMDELIR